MAKREIYSNTRGDFISTVPPVWRNWPGERWEAVPETKHRLYVSNYGRISKHVVYSTRTRKYNTHIRVKPHRVTDGLELRIKKKPKYCKRLQLIVADLFQLRGPKEKVLFKDGNRLNVRLSNLMVEGQYSWQKLTAPQRQLAKELFKKYPQRQIVTELAIRFMVNYKTMWLVYKEFRDENAIAGNTTYEHLASNQRLLSRVPDMHMGSEGDLLRPNE